MTRTVVFLPPSMLDDLHALATLKQISVAALIRWSLSEILERSSDREAAMGALTRKGNLQTKAQTAVGKAVKDGSLVRPRNCSVCDMATSKIHAHHDDYRDPLSVRWLCAKCHRSWHLTNEALY